MKHNALIIFRHAFGQLIEHNVEAPAEGMEHRVAGNSMFRPGSLVSDAPEKVIDARVAQWRIDSLHGAQGVACPTRKYIPPEMSDAEMAQRAEDERVRNEMRQFFERRHDREQGRRHSINPGWVDQPYDPEELQRAALWEAGRIARIAHLERTYYAPILYRRRAFTWTSEQAFAMLGGYRHNRHFAYSRDCVLVPGVETVTVISDEPWCCPEISSEQAFAMLGGYRPDRHP